MKKIMLAAAAVVAMSSSAFAADILDGSKASSLTRSEMAAIQGEGGSITIVQSSSQSNSTGSGSTNGQVQQANQNVQQVGSNNTAVNLLEQNQSAVIKVTEVAPPPATPPKPPAPPKPHHPKYKKWHWKH